MSTKSSETLPILTEGDVVLVRRSVKERAAALGFSVVDQTKIVTAASELGRNTLVHGGGGQAVLESVERDGKRGLRLVFEDKGPGIADIPRAMTDGFTSGKGMGLGLGGSKRLMNEFDIQSEPGNGTRVTVARWR